MEEKLECLSLETNQESATRKIEILPKKKQNWSRYTGN